MDITLEDALRAEQNRFQITYHTEIAELLSKLNISLAITTYQAGKLIFISPDGEEKLRQTPVSFKKPMGLAFSGNKLAVATLDEIQLFAHSQDLAEDFPYSDRELDTLYLPRATYYCGQTDLHDIHFGNGGLWGVNTLFSCIASFDINHSFKARWKPSFVSELTPEDRCHLNGMATKDNVPKYVTALGKTDHAGGWRDNITTGGVLMSVPDGEVLLENLPMPHSPRIYQEELYVLLSATGEVAKCNVEEGTYEVLFKIPGFIRGLAIYDGYMFIGQSKVRKSSKTFNKLPVSEMSNQAGIIVYNLDKGEKVGELMYDATVEEIYDVQVLPDSINPGILNDERHRLAVSTSFNSFWKKDKPINN